MRDRRWLVWIGLIAVAGLALRIAYVLITKNPRAVGGDSFYYHHGANLLVDGRGFVPAEVSLVLLGSVGVDAAIRRIGGLVRDHRTARAPDGVQPSNDSAGVETRALRILRPS
jgi:hypothetical protein